MSLGRACAVAAGLAGPALFFACGDRTGLLAPDPSDASAPGDEPAPVQPDSADAPVDSPAPVDAIEEIPGLDARPLRDANRAVCADASATLVYAVTEHDAILRFDPSSATFTSIGTLACNSPDQPFSMAVDRQGIAYVLYANYSTQIPGSIFRVSLATAACVPTSFAPGPSAFDAFGMGFSADDVGTGETLYVAAATADAGSALGSIDTTSLALTTIGPFNPPVTQPELSGTGDGRLFAFYSTSAGRTSSAIAQIDKATGAVVAEDALDGVGQGDAWAFGFWGGDFYLFTAPEKSPGTAATETIVTRYSPADKSVTQVARYPDLIVGAGVSTCAPEE